MARFTDTARPETALQRMCRGPLRSWNGGYYGRSGDCRLSGNGGVFGSLWCSPAVLRLLRPGGRRGLVALSDAHGTYPVYGHGGHLFCGGSGGAALAFSGGLGEVSRDGVSHRGYFPSGTRGGDLLDGLLSCDGPSGAGGGQRACGGEGRRGHCAGDCAGIRNPGPGFPGQENSLIAASPARRGVSASAERGRLFRCRGCSHRALTGGPAAHFYPQLSQGHFSENGSEKCPFFIKQFSASLNRVFKMKNKVEWTLKRKSYRIEAKKAERKIRRNGSHIRESQLPLSL